MREFACRSLGQDCSWKHAGRTEELLTDVVALHMRDVHGMKALDTAMVARIKSVFSRPDDTEGKDARDGGDPAMKVYQCDLGPGCGFRYIAQTEDLIVDGVAVHAREAHDIREFTSEMKVKVGNALQEWKG